jgi:hypothetical protein
MKRGITWKPIGPAALDRLPVGFRFRGIPVKADMLWNVIAEARGFWPFKHIAVGARFFDLSWSEQQAVLLHELKHIKAWHMEIRALCVPLCWTEAVRFMCQRQEYAADEFAASQGFGQGMAIFLMRCGKPPTRYYPDPQLRIAALRLYLEGEANGRVAA